ncbi:hypothetical protein JX266_003217 [Neoarthrinium moseri]|nr:hypothetical protein JX266_003217 [Neoarthrinium moseri]
MSVSAASETLGNAQHEPVVSFPQFKTLPAEIRGLIWEFAIPGDVPELHIVKPYSKWPHCYPTVDIAFPAVLHVSREARQCVLRRLKMRDCPAIGFQVPCRDFRPDLDTMFIGGLEHRDFFSRPESCYRGLVKTLRRIAIDIVSTTYSSGIPAVLPHLDSLETLIIVFSKTRNIHHQGEALASEKSNWRCRLQSFTSEELSLTRVKTYEGGIDFLPPETYIARFQERLAKKTQGLMRSWGDEVKICAWDYANDKLSLEVIPQRFVEYYLGSSGPEWRPRR